MGLFFPGGLGGRVFLASSRGSAIASGRRPAKRVRPRRCNILSGPFREQAMLDVTSTRGRPYYGRAAGRRARLVHAVVVICCVVVVSHTLVAPRSSVKYRHRW